MSDQFNPSVTLWKRRKGIFSTILSAVCVLSLLIIIDYEEISHVEVDYWSAAASFFMLALAYCTRSMFYKVALFDRIISLTEMYSVVSVHGFLLTLLPAGTGYLSYPYLLKKYFNIEVGRSINSVSIFIVSKFVGLILLAIWSWYAIGLKFPTVHWAGLEFTLFMLILALAAVLMGYRWSLKYKGRNKLLTWLNRYVLDSKALVLDLCDVKLLAKLLFLVVCNIFLELYYFYFAYRSFGASLPFVYVCFIVSASTLFNILPIHGFGKLGSYEIFNAGLLALIGFNKNQAIQLSFEVHFLLILQQALLWFVSYIMLRKKAHEKSVCSLGIVDGSG